jgi:hypothetical protein
MGREIPIIENDHQSSTIPMDNSEGRAYNQ